MSSNYFRYAGDVLTYSIRKNWLRRGNVLKNLSENSKETGLRRKKTLDIVMSEYN